MKLTLGISTCPNDTYIFDAAIHHKIDTENIEFELVMADVEELNKKAFQGDIDVTKLSYHAFAYVTDKFWLADAGSALGRKNGPLLIAKRPISPAEITNLRIGIPGKHTTANLLLGIAFPNAANKQELLFSDIENELLRDEIDLGLIIHENRFTYEARGLLKIMDLGDFWEQTTGLPIPLGGIVVNRRLGAETAQKVSRVIRRSLEFAFQNPKSSLPFVKQFAQEMDEDVMYKHIMLYVNEFSLSLGNTGREAVRELLRTAKEKGLISSIADNIFIE
jgi:1,4-dihydroxy-6-naphthoate synthase